MRAWPAQFVAIMLLTNVFFVPFLAQRAAPQPHASGLEPPERTAASLSARTAASYSRTIADAQQKIRDAATQEHEHAAKWATAGRGIAGVCLFVGGMSIAWAAFARPDLGGDFAQRANHAAQRYSSDRVFYAFVVDAGLYGFWQAWVMRDMGAPRRFCAVPFFGQAAWLLAGRPKS